MTEAKPKDPAPARRTPKKRAAHRKRGTPDENFFENSTEMFPKKKHTPVRLTPITVGSFTYYAWKTSSPTDIDYALDLMTLPYQGIC